jgi:hypothetical protein
MARINSVVGLIRCPADAETITTIAAASGLSVQAGSDPQLFYLSNSGRRVEPDVGADLFEVVQAALDQAVRAGTIPSWSVVAQSGDGA